MIINTLGAENVGNCRVFALPMRVFEVFLRDFEDGGKRYCTAFFVIYLNYFVMMGAHIA